MALKVHDTNLIYPGIIGQQASGFEVRVSTNRYFHVHQQWRDAISDKQVNTEKQAHSWSHRKICIQNNQCHQWWFSHTMCGSVAKEQCNTALTTLSRLLWAKRRMVAYTWWFTLRQVRRKHNQRNHSRSTGVGSKHTPSTVTIIAFAPQKVVLGQTYNNVQLVDVNVETLLAQKYHLESTNHKVVVQGEIQSQLK